MTNPGPTAVNAEHWLDEAVMCTTLLSGRYRDELAALLAHARRLITAAAPNDSGRRLIRAAARRAVTQIDRRVISLIPESREDRAVLVHAHTACDRLLSTLPELRDARG